MNHSPTPGVLETVVSEEELKGAHPAGPDDEPPVLPKSVLAAYRRTKKVCEAQDMKARQTCAVLRAKREGNDRPFGPAIIEESVTKVQTSLNDF